ncbi:hypothetical protein TSAR_000526 [Trichomalopsis sarcophagae]|uniref:Uncharacterized protein n=1 Tax=Trichomalopsis sarcophagae TaxID=543379 RepID=A0A232FIS9_9HYME|nr:hypothetical protein TSAR_000526 [Trichomalopsis sarcophagae]
MDFLMFVKPAPNMLKELIEDVGDWGYSLIVDKSTDVATMKFLCLCIKYFSHKQNRIVTDYLGLIEVVKADANTLSYAIIEYCKKINLNLKNLIGLGTDGEYKTTWETINTGVEADNMDTAEENNTDIDNNNKNIRSESSSGGRKPSPRLLFCDY